MEHTTHITSEQLEAYLCRLRKDGHSAFTIVKCAQGIARFLARTGGWPKAMCRKNCQAIRIPRKLREQCLRLRQQVDNEATSLEQFSNPAAD